VFVLQCLYPHVAAVAARTRFVCFEHGIPLPYIAAAEEFLGMSIATQWLRSAGAVFVKRGGALAGDTLCVPVVNTAFTLTGGHTLC